ncbi:MAG: DEAD/DEAH box helicase [Anaerolineales bacterium]|nr:DEAD/DEAH box helicase [Anaerolineales bacterium]
MSLNLLLDSWRTDPLTAPNLPAWRILPPRPADLRPFPPDLPPALEDSLTARGITSLYSHQVQAWELTRQGNNIVLATGTASGKTLGYNLPVLAALFESAEARALYLFPTKALTQDQLSVLQKVLITDHWSQITSIYDGDTPQSHRPQIRKNARILLTNPDMLHTGILPHHTKWAEFFRNLKFVVIDEMHTYRGVFGSHVANVIRRLKRVARFYGANPQFILTSATIGNPVELAGWLVEEPVVLIEKDGSSRGERHFLIYNPPVVDEAIGLRKRSLLESVRLAQDLQAAGVQSVVFARSRRSVEMILKYLQESPTRPSAALPKSFGVGEGRGGEGSRGYRSGYLPSQRREIEKGLRDGTVHTVVATNALELGIDIGGLGAAVLVGYPGTIASTWQQAGRAGRGDEPAAAVLVASASPLDQFLAHHPDYFFGRSPEQALVNPDHLLILLNHLRCAMFELPFQKGETFGGRAVDEFLEFLVTSNESHFSNGRFYWMADSYPAANISLRSASPESFILQATEENGPRTVGIVDGESAFWMVHPGAVYLHEAQSFFVEKLDLDQKIAHLRPLESDYFTEPLKQTTVQILSVTDHTPRVTHDTNWGELQVTTQVTGFRKLRWYTRENLGQEPLDLPTTDLQTTGYWFSISEKTVERLSQDGLWTNAPNDYGHGWPRLRNAVRARDGYRCQVCGLAETSRQHDVHHKVPLRALIRSATTPVVTKQQSQENMHSAVEHTSRSEASPDAAMRNHEISRSAIARANQMDNLITLCPACHRKVEANVRMRSGLAGLGYVLGQLAPLFLMCDPSDLGIFTDPAWAYAENLPSVVLYDLVPAGIGFSQKLYEMHDELLAHAEELIRACGCADGCPSCVGPAGENGMGGRQETLAILRELSIPPDQKIGETGTV